MKARAYYNEIDPAAAHVLREMISTGVIAPGDVDNRSIKEVQPYDLEDYTQCHFFAGGGLWSVAARMAGWPDDRPIWTGSCPCQGESVAGKKLGAMDPRDLWPDLFRLIRSCRPDVVMGEQVARAVGTHWLDRTCADLEGDDYAVGAVDLPACAVDGPHQRQRLYWIARAMDDGERARLEGQRRHGAVGGGWQGEAGPIAKANGGSQPYAISIGPLKQGEQIRPRWNATPTRDVVNGSFWSDAEWIISPIDGKARRSKPGIRFLVDGLPGGLAGDGYFGSDFARDRARLAIKGVFLVKDLPGRVDAWRLAGNAVVPQLAAEVIAAYLDTEAA